MFRHFEIKREQFRAEKLCKDITLEDMGPADLKCIDNGHVQLLPIRDRAGRLINATMINHLKYSEHDNAVR
jgi:hypothetical protein